MTLIEFIKALKALRRPDLEVRFPWPAPPDHPERTTTAMGTPFMQVRQLDGRPTLVLGNTVQDTQPNLNLEYDLFQATLRDAKKGLLAQTANVQQMTHISPPFARKQETSEAEQAARQIRDMLRHRQIILYEATTPQLTLCYVLVLVEHQPTQDTLQAAVHAATLLEKASGIEPIPMVACIEPTPDHPDPAVRQHVLGDVNINCRRCHAQFRTRRAAEIHLALEAAESENIGQTKEWHNFQHDLTLLEAEIQHQILLRQEQP